MLLIFTQERSDIKFGRDTEEFYNPKITKVEVTVEGSPNELYAQNMEYRHQYDDNYETLWRRKAKRCWRYPKRSTVA